MPAQQTTDARTVLAICAVQLVLWTLAPSLGFLSPPLDVVENIAWSRSLEWGYYKHPPLQVWLTAGAMQLGGVWAVYLLSQLCVVACYAALWTLGRELIGSRPALLAVMLFSLVYYANIPTPEFNANVLQMPLWAWAGVALWRGLTRPGIGWWLLLAGATTAALYTKYSVIFLVAALVVGGLTLRGWRLVLERRMWLAIAMATLLCLPHLMWLHDSGYQPIIYAQLRSETLAGFARVVDPLRFLGAQLLDHAGAILLLLVGGALAAWRGGAAQPDGRAARHFLLALAFGPLAAMVVLGLLRGSGLKDMWGAPAVIWVSLWAAAQFRVEDLSWARMRGLFWPVIIAAPIGVGVAAVFAGSFTEKLPKTSWPSEELSNQLLAEWTLRQDTPLRIISGPTWEAGFITAFASSRSQFFVRHELAINPWITETRLREEGALVLGHTGVKDAAPSWPEWLPRDAPRGWTAIAGDGRARGLHWAILAPGRYEEP